PPPVLFPPLPLSFYLIRPHPSSTLFPYTTLFRSGPRTAQAGGEGQPRAQARHPDRTLRRLPRRIRPDPDHDRRTRVRRPEVPRRDRKSTRLNSSHVSISYAVFCLKKKNKNTRPSD